MSSLTDDLIALEEMEQKAFTELSKLEPDHELIKLREVPGDVFTDALWDKQTPWRDEPKGSLIGMRVRTNWYIKVRDYLKEKHSITI